jgi:protein-disulfide isomerase
VASLVKWCAAVLVVAAAATTQAQGTLAGAPTRGSDNAPVTIVEYTDFQCPFCARASVTVARVVAAYQGKVRWVLKQYPLPLHADAPLAHRAALAADTQGKFWEMHDALFANQRALKRDDLLGYARRLGLDIIRFTTDLDSNRFDAVLHRDVAEGTKLGVDGTPTFFVNGKRLVGAVPYETFTAAIDRALRTSAPTSAEAMDEVMSRGPLDAPVTIKWFADITSPLHRESLVLLRRIVDAHPRDVRVLIRLAPSPTRENARLVHEAALAAAESGAFWELHDVLMNRPTLSDRSAFIEYATRLGVERKAFTESLASGRALGWLERHLSEAQSLDVRGTPTFFVNTVRVDGVVSFEELDRVVAAALASPRF